MLHHPISTPATVVEVEHDFTTMKFNRSLDQRWPYTRSGSAWIVPMDPADSWEKHIKYLYVAALIACAVLYLLFEVSK